MIISASRRTDIPAFYADWFMNRIRQGHFNRVNPFNSKQVSGISLRPEHVEAICFWSKYPRPLMNHLDELDGRGFNYYFQFTLNPYDRRFEPQVPPLDERISTFADLAARIGPEKVIWRYDPIILTSVTPVEWHLERLEQIASQLSKATRRLVFSFYDFYGRGDGRLHKNLKGTEIRLEDITGNDRKESLEQVVEGIGKIASRNNMQIFSCSEAYDLSAFGIQRSSCIDGSLIRNLFGVNPSNVKDRNQRDQCGCVVSVDMGFYNSCSFNCSYCYANFNERMIASNCKKHCPDSPSLLGCYESRGEIRTSPGNKKKNGVDQQDLFHEIKV